MDLFRRSILAVLLATLFAGASPAFAWGKFGHLTVCDLAYRNLTPASRTVLKQLFDNAHGGINVPAHGHVAARHYTSFNVGCLEEDEIPRRNPDDHFINYARGVAAVTDDTCPAAAAQGECILSGIRRDLAILKDPNQPRRERVFAMMAIGHWVGDVHQPLHISFADDRGGNGIDVQLQGRCGTATTRPDNLHAVWDNCLLDSGLFEDVRRRADFKKSWSRFTITYRAVDTLLANTTLDEEMQIVAGEPWQWAAESYEITRAPAVLYCIQSGSDCRYSSDDATLKPGAPHRVEAIDQAYLAAYRSLAKERIRRAGFRLADLLNRALDPGYGGPLRDGGQPQN